MKHIYIFDEHQSSQNNGIGTYLQELLYCFNSLKYKICLIVFNAETEEFKIIKEKKIKKILFPALRSQFVYCVEVIDKLLRLYIEDNSNNIFFINHTPSDELLESMKIYFPLSKVIFTIHDFWWTMPLMGNLEEYKNNILFPNAIENIKIESEKKSLFKMYKKEKKMYELADHIICLSNDAASILQNVYKIDKNKISCTSNGLRDMKPKCLDIFQKEKIKKELYLRNEDKILLFIGRPTKQKGIFDLLAAMHLISKSYANIKLAIIGDGNEASMKEVINVSKQIASTIIMTGKLNKQEVIKWLSIADVGIIPSYYEQCSYVAIEMMMYGLPIIATDGLGVREMFTDGINAKIAQIEKGKNSHVYQSNLASEIENLIKHPVLCKHLSKEARRTYETKFTIKHMKDFYRKLIESL